jgi:hypothetical protein
VKTIIAFLVLLALLTPQKLGEQEPSDQETGAPEVGAQHAAQEVGAGEVGVQQIPTRYPGVGRLIAIGDLHGDLTASRRALRAAGAIDERDRWIGGDLVVVQLGDLLDRGDEEQAVLELFARLAEEAAAAGGAVHVLNGNHELMNVALDLRYVTPGGFEDFRDAVVVGEPDSLLLEFPEEQRARVAAFRPGGEYARMLAELNTVLVIGRNVFAHGGVLPEHVEKGLEAVNAEIRAWILGEGPNPEWVHKGCCSPTWTRIYSVDVDEAACEALTGVLEGLSAQRMIVGHSVQEEGITSYCDGKVWCVDVGMAAHYGGEVEVLEIRGDSLRVIPGE